MEQLVRVKKVNPDGTAQVLVIRESACSGDCHKCAGCGAQQETMIFSVRNPIGAGAGDTVWISGSSGSVLAAAAVMYILPLVLFFLGYFLGSMAQMGALIGGIAFALGIGLAVVYDRLVVKRKEIVYTITGYGPETKRG